MSRKEWVQAHRSKIELLARAGFAAKAIIYATIGALALQVALGLGGEIEGKSGALQMIAKQPFGSIMLSILIIGFLGYAIYRLVQGVFNTELEDNDLKGIGKRISYLFRGIVYSGLAIATTRILLKAKSDSKSASDWSSQVMAHPAGHWVIGTVGLGVICVGAYQFYKAITDKDQQKLKLGEIAPAIRPTFKKIAKLGLSARGIVFCMIGFFLLKAAWYNNSNQAKGFAETLQSLLSQPYGSILLGLVAAGMIMYAIFEAFKARYKQINIQ